jgi:hypothetical protein
MARNRNKPKTGPDLAALSDLIGERVFLMREVALTLGLSEAGLRYRCRRMGITPFVGGGGRMLVQSQVRQLAMVPVAAYGSAVQGKEA